MGENSHHDRTPVSARLHDALGEPYVACTAEGEPVRWNERFAELIGYSDGEIASGRMSDFVAPGDREALKDAVESALEGNEVASLLTLRAADGRERTYRFAWTDCPTADDEANGRLVVGAGREADLDPTPESVEEHLDARAVESVLSLLRDLPVYVYTQDRDLRYTWFNGTAPGINEEELVGEGVRSFASEEQAGRLEDAKREVLASGEPAHLDVTFTVDGERRVFSVHLVPRYDEEGGVRGLVGVTVEVSALRRAEDQFQALVERVTEYAIFMLDVDGRIVTWNEGARRIKGFTEEEIVGRHFSVLYPEEARKEGVPGRILAEAARRGHVETEGWRVRSDGSRFWARVTVTALHDENDQLGGYVKVTRDMTERRERERRLGEEIVEAEKANRRLQLIQRVASTANRAESFEEALEDVLATVTERTDWSLGHVYRASDDGRLRPTGIWSGKTERFDRFRRLTSETIFSPGEGLPGRATSAGKPVWHEDIREDPAPGARSVSDVDVRAGFALPIVVDEPVAVLELFSGDRRSPEESFLDAMDSVGGQLARAAERLRRVEQLRRSEQRYRHLFEEAQEAIAITTPAGRLLDANPAAEALLGYEKEELREIQVQELYVDPEERRRAREIMADQGYVRNLEVRLRTKDGEEVVCQVSSTPRTGSDGEVESFQNFFRDVTRQRRAFEALEASEEKFRTLSEKALVGIYLVRDGSYEYVNPRFARIFGYDREEILDEVGPGDLTASEDWPVFREEGRDRAEGEVPSSHVELRGRTRDGEIVYLEALASRIQYEEAPAILGTVQDVTERRRLQEELLELKERERRRVGQELHDGLASHLTGLSMMFRGIIGEVEAGEGAEPEDLREIQDMIEEAATQTRSLSHGLMPVRLTNEGLVGAFEELARMTERGAEATCRYEGPVALEGEVLDEEAATHLYRIAQEAVNNAAQYAGADEIRISLEVTAEALELCVVDDGSGVTEEEFEREEGLGFRSIRSRAELLGGDYGVSTAPDEGTRVYVEVPLPVAPGRRGA